MERTILVANTNTQKRTKLNSNAETLAQLKSELDAINYDYRGLSFTEGITNTQLLDDSSQLPSNVTYKGKTTNDLIIILTNTNKKIPLGATGERAELFDFIKSHGLQPQVMVEFKKNMTQVSTAELKNFAHSHGYKAEEADSVDSPEVATEAPEEKSELDSIADDVLARHGFGASEETKDDSAASNTAKAIVDIINDLDFNLDDIEYIKSNI